MLVPPSLGMMGFIYHAQVPTWVGVSSTTILWAWGCRSLMNTYKRVLRTDRVGVGKRLRCAALRAVTATRNGFECSCRMARVRPRSEISGRHCG